MNFVTPKIIASPFTGTMVRPRVSVFTQDGKIIKEARWYCPDSGTFITKGIVSIEDVDTSTPPPPSTT